MIIFNITYHVEDDICSDFIDFVRHSFLPQLTSGGFVLDARFARIVAQHEDSGSSYSIQLGFKNSDTMDLWMDSSWNQSSADLVRRFGNKVAGFITLLEEL